MSDSFVLQQPAAKTGPEIEMESLTRVQKGCEDYPRFQSFNDREREVIKRLVHTSACFSQVINGIYFTGHAIDRIAQLLRRSCVILSDTNMIQAGLNEMYLRRWENRTVCHVSRSDVVRDAPGMGVTRSTLAVQRALLENRDSPILLACGNAPTFLYSAIETIVQNHMNADDLAIIAFPVGLVNVAESKNYTKSFMNHFGVEGMILEGSFGSSPLVVSAIHAIYRFI